MRIRDDIYDILKWVAMLVLPALATLVSTLGSIWGLPYAPQIADTIVAVHDPGHQLDRILAGGRKR